MKSLTGLLLTFFFCFSALALSSKEIKQTLNSLGQTGSEFPLPKPAPHHADYPAYEILRTLSQSGKENPQYVIQNLESLLQQTRFGGAVGTKSEFSVGTVGSFKIWREAAYLLLARSYFELGENEKALHFYSGIPGDSPFSAIAIAEKGWSLLRLGKNEEAQKNLQSKTSAKLTEPLKIQLDLQKAYLLSRSGHPAEAIQFLDKLEHSAFTKNFNWLEIFRIKVLAQSHFLLFLEQKNKLSFDEKRSRLQNLISLIEKVGIKDRDAKFSFLAGEIYWHMASALRIEDPDKYAAETKQNLAKADQWLTPWFEKSVQGEKALMDEEAFFFSAVVLWEQNRAEEAVKRLAYVPQLYPNGEYREDSYQLIGDYYFDDKKDFLRALSAYSELVKVGSNEKATYGLYKAAWSFWNLNERKKAIEHMRKLVRFHRRGLSNPQGTVSQLEIESNRDLVVFLVENGSYPVCLKELEPLNYQAHEWPPMKEQIALAYRKIGKNSEAAQAWIDLLQEKPQAKSFYWLSELGHEYLTLGQRQNIGPAIEKYLPSLIQDKSLLAAKEFSEFEKSFTQLILTIHREARKTDDSAIWKVADQLYSVFGNFFPQSQMTPIWYHAAQRQEQLGKLGPATELYKKDAMISKSESRLDSAQSVLRLLKSLLDQESIKKETDPSIYQKAATDSQWYFQNFPNEKDVFAADLIYTEATHRVGQMNLGHKHLIDRFSKLGPSSQFKILFNNENARLYQAHHWVQADSLIHALLQKSDKKTCGEFCQELELIQQEASFQEAFRLENEYKKQNSPELLSGLRDWYKKAIQIKRSPQVTLKSWHNLLLNYDSQTETAETEKLVNSLLTDLRNPSFRDVSDKGLLKNVWLRLASHYQKTGRPVPRAEALEIAVGLSETPEEKQALLWDALLIRGSYYQFQQMENLLGQLRSDRSFQMTSLQQQTLARLYYFNKNFDLSWQTLKPLLKSSPTSQAWLLLADLAHPSHQNQFKSRQELAQYLISVQSQQKENPALYGTWGYVYPETKVSLSSAQAIDPSHLTSLDLDQRLKAVSTLLGHLASERKLLQKYLENPVPQVRLEGLCLMPVLTAQITGHLVTMGKSPLPDEEWKLFEEKLIAKQEELKAIRQKEISTCESSRVQLSALMRPAESVCPSKLCASNEMVTAESIANFDQKFALQKWTLAERVTGLLKLGAFGPAEYWADLATDEADRTYLFGLIRLANKDSWNASILLKAAKETSQWRAPASELLSTHSK